MQSRIGHFPTGFAAGASPQSATIIQRALTRRYEGADTRAFRQSTASAGNGQQSRLEARKAGSKRS